MPKYVNVHAVSLFRIYKLPSYICFLKKFKKESVSPIISKSILFLCKISSKFIKKYKYIIDFLFLIDVLS